MPTERTNQFKGSKLSRKILVLTSTRAEYGLLKNLISEINACADLELCLVVTGTHLHHMFGLTVTEIEADNFTIAHKIDILDGEFGRTSIIRAMTRLQLGLDEVVNKERPDLAVLLGDRYEIFSAAGVFTLNNIPIAHIHGGELTLGAVDDAFRHSITKMSWWHFVTAETYRDRVIKLGEDPDRVFNTGSPALDTLDRAFADVDELEKFIGVELQSPVILATLHPETLSPGLVEKHFYEVWDGICASRPGTLIFTMANADEGGTIINNLLKEKFASPDAPRGKLISSFGHRRYLSMMRKADVAVGNSSSLVIEAPMVGTPSVDIGNRQKGRLRPPSVINTAFEARAICAAIKKCLDKEFRAIAKEAGHPFGTKGVAKRIVDILANRPLPKSLIKEFYE